MGRAEKKIGCKKIAFRIQALWFGPNLSNLRSHLARCLRVETRNKIGLRILFHSHISLFLLEAQTCLMIPFAIPFAPGCNRHLHNLTFLSFASLLSRFNAAPLATVVHQGWSMGPRAGRGPPQSLRLGNPPRPQFTTLPTQIDFLLQFSTLKRTKTRTGNTRPTQIDTGRFLGSVVRSRETAEGQKGMHYLATNSSCQSFPVHCHCHSGQGSTQNTLSDRACGT